MAIPYVLSGDVKILWNKHCLEKGWVAPEEKLIDSQRQLLKHTLEDMFARVDVLDDYDLRDGLMRLLGNTNHMLIALENVYSSGVQHRVNICRSVNSFGDSDVFPQSRWGSDSFGRQIVGIPKEKAVLVDDVAFSGKSMKWLILELAKHRIPIQAVYVCIGTDEAKEAITNYSLGDMDTPKNTGYFSCKQYSEVLDQVCERDFYPGMPFSGRQHAGHDGAGFPYLLPWGRPTEWASIPEKEQKRFSRVCIQNAIELYRSTEEVNGVQMKLGDLPRKFLANRGSIALCEYSERVIDYLHRMYKLV